MIRVPLSFLDHIETPVFLFAAAEPRAPSLQWLNPAAATACEAAPEALSGMSPSALWGDDAGLLEKRFAASLKDGRCRFTSLELSPGKEHHMMFFAVAGKSRQKHQIVMICTGRRDEAVTLNPEPTFVGLASEGLQGPLRNMRVLLESMEETPDRPVSAFSDAIDTLKRVCDRAFDKISETVVYCRTRMAPQHQAVIDFHQLVMRVAVQEDPYDLSDIAVPHVDISTDQVALSAAMTALMARAFREGCRGITVDVSVEETGDGLLAVTVEDTGPVLAADEIAALRFGRWHDGVPFGLCALRQLVKERGGSVNASSLSGKSQVRFTLPGRFDTPQA